MRLALATLTSVLAFAAGVHLGRNDPAVQRLELARPLVVPGCGGYGNLQTK